MKRNNGFTLIEIMIVVVVLGILAAIGIPVYMQNVITSHLVEAPTNLSSWATQMEQYYQDNHTYGTYGTANTGCAVAVPTGKYFTYTCTPCGVQASDSVRVTAGTFSTGSACTAPSDATAAAANAVGYVLIATSTTAGDGSSAAATQPWVFKLDDQGNQWTISPYHSTASGACWFKSIGQTAC